MESEILVETFLACKLTEQNPIFEWNPEKLDDSIQHSGDKFAKPKHALILKRAIIDPEAKDGELNVVEIETKDVLGEVVKVPLAFLQFGSTLQTSLDIPIHDTLVKFILTKGTGPVHIIATHKITAPNMDEGDDDDIDEEEIIENGDSDDETEPITTNGKKGPEPETEAPVNDRKRKIDTEDESNIKKIKTTVENGAKDAPVETKEPESIEMDSTNEAK